MPLVLMSFVENKRIREILTNQGERIGAIVAKALDYETADVAVKPDVLEPQDEALSYNLPELEFNIVGGSRFAENEQLKAAEIWAQLVIQIPELSKLHIAVWLQSTTGAYVDSDH